MSTELVRFLFLWEQPTDPEAFEKHYREVHIPLARKLPGLRSYAITDDPQPVRGEPYYRIAELRWDSMDELRTAFASPAGQACAEDATGMAENAAARSMILGAPQELF
ncbi:EthD family reductase [Catenulispora pinisilvae]|uniref:EthD family reductase n=1 Tax=Catenulispora pinisilvae TaxID=2705253 RepID=UPI0018912E84|nr:EthD family reductase [Catenulispora pinisilvae]